MLNQNKKESYILLDDDIGLTTGWELEAFSADVELTVFNDVEFFKKVIDTLDKSATLCIDLNLPDNISGLQVAKWCKEKGFERIFIVTGAASFDHQHIDWIQGVLGKYPPFSNPRK